MTLEQLHQSLELERRRFLMGKTADVIATLEVQIVQSNTRWPALYAEALAMAEATVDLAIARWCLQLSKDLGTAMHHVAQRLPKPPPPRFFDRLASRSLQQRRAIDTASRYSIRLLERRSRDVIEDHLDTISGPLNVWVEQP